MEKRAITIICRLCVGLAAFALTFSMASAQNLLLNPGFETTSDGVNATNWIQFGGAALSSTNNTLLTIHSGQYSMSCPTPGTGTTPIGAGAYQDVAASAGSNWRLTGYWFAWQNARPVGADRFAVAQLAFMDNTGGTGNVLQLNESLHYGITGPLPINTWTFFQVDGTNAPAGTTKVRVYVMYVGDSLDAGNFFFDDLTLYNPSGSQSPQAVISQPAVQILFPTSTPTNQIDYQVQSITNLVFTVQSGASNVLVNPGFEANAVTNDTDCGGSSTITGWTLGGVSSYSSVDSGGPANTNSCYPVHGGIGALSELANGNPPVVYQSFPATPGQVWNFTGYGFVCENICEVTPSSNFRGLLKMVWNDSTGAAIPPLVDTNFVGALDTAPYYGITSSPQLTSGSQPDTWTLMECQGTAPAGTASVVFYNIAVGTAGDMLFDDDFATLATAPLGGWQNLGPIWLGNNMTNSVFEPIGSNTQKFYRITTP